MKRFFERLFTCAYFTAGPATLVTACAGSVSQEWFSNLESALAPTLQTVSRSMGLFKGGVSITLSGSSFLNGASISIGGIACTNVQWVSDSQLTCVTGAATTPGTWDVVVTNPNGKSSTLSGAFTGQAYLFAGNTDTETDIAGFSIDPSTGALTRSPQMYVATAQSNVGIILHPDNRFLYAIVSDFASTGMIGFEVDAATGNLATVAGASQTICNSGFDHENYYPVMAFDASGQYLYVSSKSCNSVSAYSVNQTTGALTLLQTTTVTGAVSVLIDNSTSVLYTLKPASNLLLAYKISTSGGTAGQLSALGSYATGGSPSKTIIDPTGSYLYVIENADIAMFQVNADGTLISNGTTAIAAGGIDIGLDPRGRFLFATSSSNKIYAYSIGANGVLSAATGSPYAVADTPVGLTVDPQGMNLLVGAATLEEWWAFSITQSGLNKGALTLESTIHDQQNCMAFGHVYDPSGRFLYWGNNNDWGLNGLTIGSSGGFTAMPVSYLPSTPTGAYPKVLAVTK